MIRALGLAALLACSTGAWASLLGDTLFLRFDSGGSPVVTTVVTNGVEFQDFPSPPGFPWEWTIDIQSETIEATATLFQDFDEFTPGVVVADFDWLPTPGNLIGFIFETTENVVCSGPCTT